MTGELDAVGIDAVTRARRVALNAHLMEQARGKQHWASIAWAAFLVTVAGSYFIWVRPSVEVLVGLMLFCGIANWFDQRLSRRLDAIVRLLEQTASE